MMAGRLGWLVMCAGTLAGGAHAAGTAVDQATDFLPAPPAGQSWKLAWHDEFDGQALDRTKWVVRDNPRHECYWSPKAVVLDGQGHLLIRTFQEDGKFFNGCVETSGLFEHAYGYYSARCQLQHSAGHWPAFWLQTPSVGHVDGSGRDGSEIDIMEKPWTNNVINHAVHWDGYKKGEHKSSGFKSTTPGIMAGWHTFSLYWSPDEYVFYIDGKEVWRTKAGGVSQVPEHIKLSEEAHILDKPTAGWAGDVRKATLPDAFTVDYVRVYDLTEAATGQPVWPQPPPFAAARIAK
jgi:beta-glucanase (GH16 family)